MSVTDTSVVDAIGVDNETGQVILTLVDHLSWGDLAHIEFLRAKLNAYLAFIEGGELLDSYPQSQGRRVAIQVVCKYAPDAVGVEFFHNSERTIRNAGSDFSWRVFEQ